MSESTQKADSKDSKTLIWLDSDPGHDDFFAILLAGLHASSELIGISTVGGNQTVEKVTKNALDALYVCDLPAVPCARGQEHALMSKTVPCPEIHGESGLETKDGSRFPKHGLVPVAEKGVVSMAQGILGAPRKVTLVATGRMTNVALLLSMYPEVIRNLTEIVIMGGALRGGNTHPVCVHTRRGQSEMSLLDRVWRSRYPRD